MNIETIHRQIQSFLSWAGTSDARNQIYGWVISTVLIGGGAALILKVLKFGFRVICNRFRQSTYYRDTFGRFYLYHPPLIIGINDIPRVARLTLRRGFLHVAKAAQTDANNERFLLYRGPVEKWKSFLQFQLTSPRGECPKIIVLWHFQPFKGTSSRVTCGVMCSTNFHEEPYRVPIIVSEEPLSRIAVDEGFRILLSCTTVTRDLRRKFFDHVNASSPAAQNDEFEHMINPSGPIIKRSSYWQRIYASIKRG